MRHSLTVPWAHHSYAMQHAVEDHALISVTDLEGNITYANEKFQTVSGYSLDELIGQNHRIVRSEHQGSKFWAHVWSVISSGNSWSGQVCNTAKSGNVYWVDTRIVPLMDDTGQVEGYFSIRTEVTELVLARNKANAAVEAKTRFFANMSHELRTPMNAVLGMVRLLKHTPLNLQQSDYAGKAEASALGLLAILDDILDFSKLEVGKVLLDAQPFAIEDLMVDISTLMSANLRSNSVEVLFDVAPDVPQQTSGDFLRIKQVLTNLGGNAIKFTSEGNVVFKVCCKARTDARVTLEFSVSDTGIGIAPEHHEHIFSPFSQAESSTTRRFGGTGLGLSISRQLVEAMGGKLELESELGRGSRFHFSLDLPIVAATHRQVNAATDAANNLRDMHVLVVDDNRVACDLIAAMLRNQGVRVDVANSGEQAVRMVKQRCAPGMHQYVAIFLDWQMPGMDGWDTAHAVRSLPLQPGQQVPRLIMVTANGRENLAERSREEQSMLSGFLAKPVSVSMLINALTEHVGDAHSLMGSGEPGMGERALEGMRILVAEDNALNQQIAKELLEMQGACVTLAANGQLAVDAVAFGRPGFDAVLMDLLMPVMDGMEATQKIRNELNLKDLVIIAVSANASEEDRAESIAAGMTDHIGKPFDIRQLTGLIAGLTGWSNRLQAQAQTQTQTQTQTQKATAATEKAAPAERFSEKIDVEDALEMLGDDLSLYRNFVLSYLEDLQQTVPQLQVALSTQNFPEATRGMHTIKGLSKTVGANALADFTARYEKSLKRAELDCPAEDLFRQLQQHVDLTVQELLLVVKKIDGRAN